MNTFSKFCKLIFVSLFCLLLSGCSTIVHGTTQQIVVATTPTGATVSDGSNSIATPGTLELKRNRDYILTISKPGFATETVSISHVISGAVAGNLLAGGFIGWGVDAMTGAQWRLVPETISVHLKPLCEDKSNRDLGTEKVATVEAKLQELEILKQKNLITDDEYKAMRAITFHSFENKEASAS
jgi:hypothetical protein